MSAINVTELNERLGAHLSENKSDLIVRTLVSDTLNSTFEPWDDCKDEVPLPSLEVADLIKPADPTKFEPTANALKFGARILKVRSIKVDLLLIPQLLEKTWLGQFNRQGSDAYQMPFEQFILQYIAQKAQENLHLKAIYRGIYNAAGNTPEATMDGLIALLKKEITAEKITPVVTGVITPSNVISSIESVYDSLGEQYKGVATQAVVAPTVYDMYRRAYRKEFGVNADYAGMSSKLMLDGTNCELKREPGLGATSGVIITPVANKVYGYDSIGDSSAIETQKHDRTIKVLMDFKAGVELKEIHKDALAVNDQF